MNNESLLWSSISENQNNIIVLKRSLNDKRKELNDNKNNINQIVNDIENARLINQPLVNENEKWNQVSILKNQNITLVNSIKNLRNIIKDSRNIINNGLETLKDSVIENKLILPPEDNTLKIPNLIVSKTADVNGNLNVNNTVSPFTGSHIVYNNNKLDLHNGKIVISDGIVPEVTINNSYPFIKLANINNDKRVYGVLNIVNTKNYLTNSVGEGGIWVCNVNGNLQNGDYITSSNIAGYGMKQDDDILHSYTVAKILMDCNFDTELIEKYYVNDELNEYGKVVLQKDENKLVEKYKLRYLKLKDVEDNGNNVIEISEEEYLTRKNNNENVYKGAFVPCTYHCG